MEDTARQPLQREPLSSTHLASPSLTDAAQFESTAGAGDAHANGPTAEWRDLLAETDKRSASASRSRTLEPGATVRYFGDYEIERELGRGGMGVVYRARQISLNRPVALKMLKAGVLADEAELRRFRNEAEAVALLDHPGIVPVFEVGQHAGQRYFTMKLVDGGNLAEHLGHYRNRPREAAQLVAEAAEAVYHAHERGVLHRDLKPANVLIDTQGHPHVTDFGLAKRAEQAGDELTVSGAIQGTPGYMSPEQAEGRRGGVTTATDVYGLGAVLYALLTGQAPFKGDSVADTLRRVREQAPEPPSRANAKVPRDLQTICLKCLQKDPRRRYATAQALADDLRNWLEQRPISARPAGRVERVWLWARRRPATAALVLVGTAFLLATVGLGIAWGRQQGELARREANAAKVERGLRGEAERQAALANERLDETMRAIESYYRGVSREVLLERPEFQALRERMLERPREFYERLTREMAARPNSDEREQRRLAQGRASLGALLALLRRYDQALSELRASDALFRDLAARAPHDASLLNDRAVMLRNLARVLDETGHPRDAEAVYRTQIDMATRAAKAQPASLDNQQTLALGHTSMGLIHHDAGRLDASQAEYREAIRVYERLVEARPGDAEFQYGLSAARSNLGNVLTDMGQFAEARTYFTRATKAGEEAIEAEPKESEYRKVTAVAYYNLSRLLTKTGNMGEAEKASRRVVEIFEAVKGMQPNVPESRYGLARALDSLGTVLLDDPARLAMAEDAYRRALAELTPLLDAHADSPDYYRMAAVTYQNLGAVLIKDGRPREAEVALGKSLATHKVLADQHPEFKIPAQSTALQHMNLGLALRMQGRMLPAIEEFSKAVDVAEPAHLQEPWEINVRRALRGAHFERAVTLDLLGRTHEADADWEAALALALGAERMYVMNQRSSSKAGDVVQEQIEAAIVEARKGSLQAALDGLATLLENADRVPGRAHYDLARALSACADAARDTPARADAIAAQAVAMLRRAIDAGDFSDPRKRARLATDEDLAALHGRREFELLVGEMALPVDVFAPH